MGLLNCTTIGALIGTLVLPFCGLVSRIVGATLSIVEPVVKELRNSGEVWFPVTSVTATAQVLLAGRASAGVNVTDNPSFDNARVPTMLFGPCTTVIIPETTAASCTGCAKRTMTLPFSGTPLTPLAGWTCTTAGKEIKLTFSATGLLDTPFTVTSTFPVVAASGTGTTMLLVLQVAGVPPVPLKVTVLAACVGPKFVPVIVTEAPTVPAGVARF